MRVNRLAAGPELRQHLLRWVFRRGSARRLRRVYRSRADENVQAPAATGMEDDRCQRETVHNCQALLRPPTSPLVYRHLAPFLLVSWLWRHSASDPKRGWRWHDRWFCPPCMHFRASARPAPSEALQRWNGIGAAAQAQSSAAASVTPLPQRGPTDVPLRVRDKACAP